MCNINVLWGHNRMSIDGYAGAINVNYTLDKCKRLINWSNSN